MNGDVFDTIYRDNLWNGIDSRSGPGSGEVATKMLVDELTWVVALGNITSVLDVGCGDGFWMPDLPGYVGYDVSGLALKLARDRHPEREYVSVWPSGRHFDMVIVRDVIQHLPLAVGAELLDRIIGMSPRFLLASTYRGGINFDIPSGSAYSPDLQSPPFNLPEPAYWIFDGYHYHPTQELRDPTKFLGLWPINPGVIVPQIT